MRFFRIRAWCSLYTQRGVCSSSGDLEIEYRSEQYCSEHSGVRAFLHIQ